MLSGYLFQYIKTRVGMYGMGRGMNLNILDDSPSLSSRHSPDFKCLAWYPLLQAGCVKDFFQVDRVLAFTLAFISFLLIRNLTAWDERV